MHRWMLHPLSGRGPGKEPIMRFIGLNVAFATWLLVSAFALPQTPVSMAIAAGGAFVVPVIALLAGARPGVRFLISLLALTLAVTMLLLPDVPAPARISNWLVAALFFGLSIISPRHESRLAAQH
jgi:hypothetical protein